MEQFAERCRLDEARSIADRMINLLRDQQGVQEISVAGSFRRSLETIGDIDILIGAEADDAPALFDRFTADESVIEVLGERRVPKARCVPAKACRSTCVSYAKKQFPAALLYFTGSKEHNVALRQRARDRGLALNEYGLFKLDADGNTDFDQPVEYGSEADIYSRLDMNWVPPELREDRGEVAWFFLSILTRIW